MLFLLCIAQRWRLGLPISDGVVGTKYLPVCKMRERHDGFSGGFDSCGS
jgi:hypothetical protein